jgi:hypothetical protein
MKDWSACSMTARLVGALLSFAAVSRSMGSSVTESRIVTSLRLPPLLYTTIWCLVNHLGQVTPSAEAKALAAPMDQLTLADARALVQLLVQP